MKAAVFVLALVFLAAALVEAASAEKLELNFAGKKRTAYLYLPALAGKSARPLPLLLLLHGSGRNGQIMVEQWKPEADAQGIVLIAPDSLDPQQWTQQGDNPDFLRTVVDAARAKAAVDPRRVYVFGNSGGAVFALYLALEESEYFAGVAVHAGSLRGQEALFIPYATRKTPIQIQVGVRDQFFSLSEVRTTRDRLREAGFDVVLVEIPNHDHNYYLISKDVNHAAWEFLKQQQLAGDPNFVHYDSPSEAQ